MKDALEVLNTRRSVRAFKSDAIPQHILEQIIQAGTYAPTGRGRQSPVIIAITNRELRDKVAAENCRIGGWEKGFDPFYGAPAILLVAAKKRCAHGRVRRQLRHR